MDHLSEFDIWRPWGKTQDGHKSTVISWLEAKTEKVPPASSGARGHDAHPINAVCTAIKIHSGSIRGCLAVCFGSRNMPQDLTEKGRVYPYIVLKGTSLVKTTFGLGNSPQHGAQGEHDHAQHGDTDQKLHEREASCASHFHSSFPGGTRTGRSVLTLSCLGGCDVPHRMVTSTSCSATSTPDKCTEAGAAALLGEIGTTLAAL